MRGRQGAWAQTEGGPGACLEGRGGAPQDPRCAREPSVRLAPRIAKGAQ
jgi:hypothetical protein